MVLEIIDMVLEIVVMVLEIVNMVLQIGDMALVIVNMVLQIGDMVPNIKDMVAGIWVLYGCICVVGVHFGVYHFSKGNKKPAIPVMLRRVASYYLGVFDQCIK